MNIAAILGGPVICPALDDGCACDSTYGASSAIIPPASNGLIVERLPGVARSFARRTERLAEAQRQIGLALGGEAGARSATRQAMPVSADTLLRLANHSELAPAATPKVLGVDDWAWKKRQTCGTILIDLEQHCVVDLLADRTADTLAGRL